MRDHRQGGPTIALEHLWILESKAVTEVNKIKGVQKAELNFLFIYQHTQAAYPSRGNPSQ